MILLVIFAFIAGIVTVLSPCILPILPIVLSGTVGTGHKRPLGIVVGFILSFSFFTLTLATLVRLIGISADILRNISVLVVFMFGATLFIPQVQVGIERLFSKLSDLLSHKSSKNSQNTGFFGGILLGVSLGLVWTPCVGPILASVITLAATSSVNFSSVLITLSYASGTAIPLLAITYGGRSLLRKNQWLLANTQTIQKAFGILMILTAVAIFFNIDRQFQAYILEKFPQYGVGLTQFEDNNIIKNELDKLKNSKVNDFDNTNIADKFSKAFAQDAPELIEGGQWFNSSPLRISELKGKTVLIDFWTYTCINCIRTLPYLKSWHEKYKDNGLIIIGVHTPEFEFEKNPENLRKAINDFGLSYPIMQDNNYSTWQAYHNRFWPAKYLIDREGKIRYTHFGEGEYDETEQKIQELLNEDGSRVSAGINNPVYSVYSATPELYLGYSRIQYLSSNEVILKDQLSLYTRPENLPDSRFAYEGNWMVGAEYANPQKGSRLYLKFEASQVHLVMRRINNSKSGMVKVYLDNKLITSQEGEDLFDSVVSVKEERLYNLIKLDKSSKRVLELEFLDSNLELYAFTFG